MSEISSVKHGQVCISGFLCVHEERMLRESLIGLDQARIELPTLLNSHLGPKTTYMKLVAGTQLKRERSYMVGNHVRFSFLQSCT